MIIIITYHIWNISNTTSVQSQRTSCARCNTAEAMAQRPETAEVPKDAAALKLMRSASKEAPGEKQENPGKMVVLTCFNGKWWFSACFQRWPWAIKCEKLAKFFGRSCEFHPDKNAGSKTIKKEHSHRWKWSTKCRYLNWLVVWTPVKKY